MRLAVSNLAWPADQEEITLGWMAGHGVQGVEVAPTRVADWTALTAGLVAEYRARLSAAGLVASSLQAILFGRSELHLLGEAASFAGLCDHMRRVVDIAAALGAGVLVFGSPRNRQRGNLTEAEAWLRGRERLPLLGEIAAAAGVAIGIEPVPAFYGNDYLTGWSDVLRMVQEVDHPGIRVHLDNGCVALGGDSIGDAVTQSNGWLAHFQAAQPELGGFDQPIENHHAAAAALRTCGYDQWVAIEMREQSEDPIGAVKTAVNAIRALYWPDQTISIASG
jgi:sugar phosphate isomerase/epimerase